MSCTALFPRLGSSPFALALHFVFRAARRTCPSSCGCVATCPAPPVLLLSLCLRARCVSPEVQFVCSSLSDGGDVCNRGRFLLSESPACDVSALDVQCPPCYKAVYTEHDGIAILDAQQILLECDNDSAVKKYQLHFMQYNLFTVQ